MTATDPEHPWLFAMRRQRRWMYVTIAICMALTTGMMIAMLYLLASGMRLKYFSVAIGCMLVGLAIPYVLMSIQARKQRRWTQQMLECNGLMCPKCYLPLADAGDQATVECAKCARLYKPDELRQFWEGLVTDPMRAGSWWVQHYGAGWRATLSKWMWRNGRPQPIPLIVGNLVLWVAAGLLLSTYTRESLMVSAFKYSHMFLIMSGFVLFGIGRKTRVGDARYCAKCHYEQGPQVNVPAKCPECGSAWNTLGGAVVGQPSPNRRMMASGALLVIAGFALIFFTPFLGGWQFKLLPTGSLISQTIGKPGFTIDEWKELRTRAITPEQTRILAKGLLDKRLRQPWLSSDEGNWLVAQIVNGRLPDELTLRYYREMLEVELLAPAKAKVGEPVTLRLAFTNRGSSTTHPAAHALIGGYLIGDDPQPIGRQPSAFAGVSLDATMRGGSNVCNEVAYTPQHAGPLKVRARVWVIAAPKLAASQPIQWQPDGAPVIPPEAVWHEMREMEQTIVVE